MSLEQIKKDNAARAALNEEIAKIEAVEKAFTDALNASNADINAVVDEVMNDLREMGLQPLEPLPKQPIDKQNPPTQRLHGMLTADLVLHFLPLSIEQGSRQKHVPLYMIAAIHERTLYITGGSVTMGSCATKDYGAFTTEDIKSPSFKRALRQAFNCAIDAMRVVRPPQ